MSIGAALDATQREYLDQGATTTLDANGQSVLRSYQVDDTAKPVRVTLAWTDPPPATVTGNAFVNDLDLEVSVGGRTYRGNWLAGGALAARRPGRLPQQRGERGAPGRHRAGACR